MSEGVEGAWVAPVPVRPSLRALPRAAARRRARLARSRRPGAGCTAPQPPDLAGGGEFLLVVCVCMVYERICSCLDF